MIKAISPAKSLLVAITVLIFGMVMLPARTYAADTIVPGQPCKPTDYSTDFLGFPTWYEYLDGVGDEGQPPKCVPQLRASGASDETQGIDVSSFWLIGLAVIEILLRVAGFAAVGLVIFGGFKYITSQGSPDSTKSARNTIINAFIGMVIAIVASVSVNFLAKLLQ